MIIDLATGASRPVVVDAPIASSGRGPWNGILLEQLPFVGGLELIDVASPDAVVIVNLAAQKSCEWKDRNGSRDLRFSYGQIHFIPAMHPFTARSRHGGDLLSVTLEGQFLRCAAHDLFQGAGRMELTHQAPLDDPLLREITLALKRELEAGYPGGRVYGESLAASMAHHLVRCYSNLTAAQPTPTGLQVRPQIRRAVYYVHENFANDISLATLAAEAGLSPFHFARLFKESTGLAPHQYIVQCRVERARELLLSGAQTAAEIALAVGFCDQSHLTTHFKRLFGLTPNKFRLQAASRGSPINFRPPIAPPK
jgi:AraC family transcriptional regulator